MKNRFLSLLLLLCILLSMLMPAVSASGEIITDPTGYTQAGDVEYKTVSGYVANWGARGEISTFLSPMALEFYTGSNTYAALSQKSGGTSTSDAPSSALYQALKSFMTSKHSHETSYKETRYLYCYTDCLKNDTEHISSFYSGKELSGTWDSGSTWNREHTWPNSKGLGGNDENDIMMLRPTWVQENSDRGNTAYGESSKYYDPGEAVRGDCARIVLYVYTRWGNTGKMWGESGVIESLDILLKWMQEDPVDTWEMGRNDAVESITGTRNVFVDYPEFAWLLFGEEIPSDMATPSAGATEVECAHTQSYTIITEPTCTLAGKTDTYCRICSELISTETIAALGHDYAISTVAPTCQSNGYDLYDCTRCDDSYKKNYTSKTDCSDDSGDGLCDFCGAELVHICPCNDFSDVSPGTWYHDYAVFVIENGLMNGIASGRFDPSGCVTRAMLVTILYRIEGKPDTNTAENPFTDVPANEWYTDAVIWAADSGIVYGMTATTYEPNRNITREQIATMLYRYAIVKGEDVTLTGSETFDTFPDKNKISAYAVDAMKWAVDRGLINGISGTLSSGALAIRAQLAAMLMRYLTSAE